MAHVLQARQAVPGTLFTTTSTFFGSLEPTSSFRSPLSAHIVSATPGVASSVPTFVDSSSSGSSHTAVSWLAAFIVVLCLLLVSLAAVFVLWRKMVRWRALAMAARDNERIIVEMVDEGAGVSPLPPIVFVDEKKEKKASLHTSAPSIDTLPVWTPPASEVEGRKDGKDVLPSYASHA